MKPSRLAALASLAGVIRDRDLARLAAADETCRGLTEDLSAGQMALAGRAAEVAALAAPDPAMRGRADLAWREAEKRRLAAIGLALAQAAAQRETARAIALRAVGRADILDRLKDGKLEL